MGLASASECERLRIRSRLLHTAGISVIPVAIGLP